jgi:hypothetical protein
VADRFLNADVSPEPPPNYLETGTTAFFQVYERFGVGTYRRDRYKLVSTLQYYSLIAAGLISCAVALRYLPPRVFREGLVDALPFLSTALALGVVIRWMRGKFLDHIKQLRAQAEEEHSTFLTKLRQTLRGPFEPAEVQFDAAMIPRGQVYQIVDRTRSISFFRYSLLRLRLRLFLLIAPADIYFLQFPLSRQVHFIAERRGTTYIRWWRARFVTWRLSRIVRRYKPFMRFSGDHSVPVDDLIQELKEARRAFATYRPPPLGHYTVLVRPRSVTSRASTQKTAEPNYRASR